MPGKDGFSFFELLNKIGINIQVVIVSAHLPKYYSKALDLELTLYLEKPVWEKELKEILDKVHGRIANRQSFDKIPFISLLDAKRKILLNTPRGTIYLYPEEILYARADKKCTDIWIRNVGKVKVSKGITDIYHLLNDTNIYKADKSWLINLMYLKEIIEPSETLKIAISETGYDEITITSEGFSNLKQHIKKLKKT